MRQIVGVSISLDTIVYILVDYGNPPLSEGSYINVYVRDRDHGDGAHGLARAYRLPDNRASRLLS